MNIHDTEPGSRLRDRLLSTTASVNDYGTDWGGGDWGGGGASGSYAYDGGGASYEGEDEGYEGDDDSAGDGGDADDHDFEDGDEGDEDEIDLQSTNPLDFYDPRWPKDHPLSMKQLKALVDFNPMDQSAQPTPRGRQPAAPRGARTAPQSGRQPAGPGSNQAPALPQGYRLLENGAMVGPDNKFVKKEVAAQILAKARKAGGRQAAGPAARRPGAPPPRQPAPRTAPTGDPRMEQLISGLAEVIEQARGGGDGGTQPKGGAKKPRYMYGDMKPALQIPKQIFDGMSAEDPNVRYQALNHLINAMMNTVYQDSAATTVAMRKQIVEQELPAALAARHKQQNASAAFYNRYHWLNRRELHGFLSELSGQLGREWAAEGYDWRGQDGNMSEQFADALYSRYAEVVGLGAREEAHFPPGQTHQDDTYSDPRRASVRRPARQPYFSRTTSRVGRSGRAGAKTNDIMAVVNSR